MWGPTLTGSPHGDPVLPASEMRREDQGACTRPLPSGASGWAREAWEGGLRVLLGVRGITIFEGRPTCPVAGGPSVAQPRRGQRGGSSPPGGQRQERQDPTIVGGLGSAPWSPSDTVPPPPPRLCKRVGTYSGLGAD